MNGCDAISDPGTGGGVVHLRYLECIFGNVINLILGFAGIAFFIMLLIGGFTFLTAGADPKKAESAQKTLTQAVAGLVIVIVAFLIIKAVSLFTGVPGITTFDIYLN